MWKRERKTAVRFAGKGCYCGGTGSGARKALLRQRNARERGDTSPVTNNEHLRLRC